MAAPEGYKTLGKIGISYKGDYNSNIAYERLDAVYHNGSTYLAIKDAPDGAPRDDKLNWIYLAKGFSGDIGYSEIAFTEAENRENINTGESVKTVFGKIKKFFADLTAPAFAQMITSKDDLLATKATGYVPDAKAVADAVTDVTGKLNKDSGWIKIIDGLSIRKVQNIVEIKCYLISTLLKKNEWITIANLPEGFIPSETFYGYCYNDPLSDSRTVFAVAIDGTIKANNNATANMTFIFQCTYTV